ncbi:hypothetical protein FSARC_3614 [Fusarium sarcochroum]|uniref:Nephrocystin 3-like N-terminal domain-containing protein n=1 Tax=Fusarium sarcochroum TaxID=1208366 RepID=A0A8H4XCE8_9HYPO|nr:hypothetical protein FSARC_3614 [Fusarium sarcochroum]
MKNNASKRSSLQILTPGTCEWIPKTQEYQDWNAARDGLLWISGPPGKGKTIMSIFLTQLLETSKPDATVIWFFCDNKDESRNIASNILRGLMTQLVLKHNHLIPCLLSTWKMQRDTLFRSDSFETLWRIFLSMLEGLDGQEVCCVLDGLDECVESSLALLLFKLKTLFQHQRSPGSQSTWKIVIVSREQPQSISETLSTFPRIALEDLEHDINLYITDCVTHLARVKNIQNSPLGLQIETALREGAKGTFLWVSFMSQDLENSTLNEIEDALAQLPRGLYSVYQRIIDQIKPDNSAAISDMLTWILFANRPLELAELCDAVQIEPTKALSREQVCLGYVKSCGHLLQLHSLDTDRQVRTAHVSSVPQVNQESQAPVVDGSEEYKDTLQVTLVHQSAKDFLLSMDVDRSLLRPAINDGQGHAVIVDRLIALLSEHLSNATVDLIETEARVPLLTYAIGWWPNHMAELQDDCKAVLLKHAAFFGNTSKARDNYLHHGIMGEPVGPLHDVPFLHMACELRLYHLIEAWLLPRNALLRLRRKRKINQKWGTYGETPLHRAVRRSQKKTVRVLLKYGADVTIENVLCETPIHVALQLFVRCEEIYRLLLTSKKGKAVLKKEAKCYTKEPEWRPSLLHLAAEKGSERICQELIENFHYDVDSKTLVRKTPLHSALKYKRKHLANLLVNRWGASLIPHIELLKSTVMIDYDLGEDTLEACLQMLTQDWGCDINTTDESGNTVFHYYGFGFMAFRAIQTCQLTIDWDQRNEIGETFLHANPEWLRDARLLCVFLQHSRWGINTTDNKGRTPLHALVLEIQEDCDLQITTKETPVDIRVPLDFGADRSLTDDEGTTVSDMLIVLMKSSPQSYLQTEVRNWAEQAIETLASYETVTINPQEVDIHLESAEWYSS